MSFELLVGPPGSGKTHALLNRSRRLCADGKRVWWAGLPNQRAHVYRAATAGGALLGFEFVTLQQTYYRLLARARALKPLVVGTGRLALVGEALSLERDGPPSPGEGRLFSAAIAEAKRYGLSPADIPAGDFEVERLRAVYRRYELLKGEAWDYDDFRREALALAEAGLARPEADALVVAGLREIAPLDLRLLRSLGEVCRVTVALPEAPAGWTASEVLEPRPTARISCFRAENPVAEARWVLRSLKRDLAEGCDPLDLAVVMPGGQFAAFEALADEYGVPLMDERPLALAQTVAGRLLVGLLELPDDPTASRLLPIGELAPLADAALSAGVAGRRPLEALAERLGLGETWRAWQERLAVPGDRERWAEGLVSLALDRAEAFPEGRRLEAEAFRRHALARAKEAARVATGSGFRAWWSALLAEAGISLPTAGGVALLDERLASGRRFRRGYIVGAVKGAYATGEREDYFLAEEARSPLEALYRGARTALPRRHAGRDRLLFADLGSLADDLTITFPEADQDGPLLAEPALIAPSDATPLPLLPAGSRLELAGGEPFRASSEPAAVSGAQPETGPGAPAASPQERALRPSGGQNDERVAVEELRRFAECPMRYWLEGLLGDGTGEERRGSRAEVRPWQDLLAGLLERPTLDQARLEALARSNLEAAEWLSRHRELLMRLTFGVSLPARGEGPFATIDAAERRGREASLYLFCPPSAALDGEAARERIDGRWNELWAAGHLLRGYRGRIERVRIFVWPLLDDPREAFQGGVSYPWKRIVERLEGAGEAWHRLRKGVISASPGYRCRECRMRDACREAAP